MLATRCYGVDGYPIARGDLRVGDMVEAVREQKRRGVGHDEGPRPAAGIGLMSRGVLAASRGRLPRLTRRVTEGAEQKG